MLDEIIRSARTSLGERLSSPLAGSFVTAWCLWNYKFLVILFSAASVTRTFELIDSVVFPDLLSSLLQGFVFPAFTAAAYIFIYPYPAKYVFEFTRKRQKDINDVRRRIANETPLTIEESRKIRAAFERLENNSKEEVDRKNLEIERLKDVVLALQHPPEKPTESNSPATSPSIPDSQIQLLRYLEQKDGVSPHEHFLAQSEESRVKTEYDLGELEHLGLIEKHYDNDYEDNVYRFTHEGRRVLLEHPEVIPF